MATNRRPGFPSVFSSRASGPFDYLYDAAQRSVLFLSVMRDRALQFEAQVAKVAPNVLDFTVDPVVDGRQLDRPVNYLLTRVRPVPGLPVDERKRPFVIVDPRAGHGPGIGGFKADSEIGVAMRAGHPVYFIGFLPMPEPGQTILDVTAAQAIFLETVIAHHPDADGRPCVVGNCQAGWAVMMLAALRPELFGPIIVAGAPLSYWAGVRGQYPMRYSGGLLGGSWMTALASDLGGGIFDGTWLVENFENQNPANTLWSKQYNLYAKVDTEAERYLGFEKWWDAHVCLNGDEIQFIVDELFIGNRLAAGEIVARDDTRIDLRAVRGPIVVFCSRGDNITPPQQALQWLLDLYDNEEEIIAHGQTIVYTIHDTIGHLGIFVASSVARKEHDQFAANIDMIDVLPPGLYEAVLTPASEAVNPGLITGEWLMRCERRTLQDIRALGGNDLADERRFDAASRVSDINLALYRTFAQPLVRAMVTPASAEATRRLHPLRLGYEFFGPRNPLLAWVPTAADRVRESRRPVAADNPWFAAQEQASAQVVAALEGWRQFAERLAEASFLAIYGSELLQSAVGVRTDATHPPRKAPKSLLHDAMVRERIAHFRTHMAMGGSMEALVRAQVYIGLGRGFVDERGFATVRIIRETYAPAAALSLADFKTMVREQFFMLMIDETAALAAIPRLLPDDAAARKEAFDVVATIAAAVGSPDPATRPRLDRIASLFGVEEAASSPGVAPAAS